MQAVNMLAWIMFTISPCAAGCGRPAISGSNLCYVHQVNQEQETRRIVAAIAETETTRDMVVAGMHFTGVDFSHHRYYGCNFRDACFSQCVFSGAVMRMCFFDFAEFTGCEFIRTDMQFVSFAGTRITGCRFEGSELVHVNFLGAAIAGTSFSNSNLYNSRFINAGLDKIQFTDCNVKQTNFISAVQTDVIFKSSNTAEAVFEQEEP